MKVTECLLIPTRVRLGITLIIVLMVISSPVLMLANPALLAASSPGGADDVATYAPSTISQGGSDFTAQAPLLGPATFRSTDLVSSTAIYEIQFITTTTGVIDKIDITFPLGTVVAAAGIIEREGIGPGALTKSGPTVTLDVHTPVSIPAGTFIRLEMVDIGNPASPANYKISVQTRDPSNQVIDGPSLSPAYTIRQVSTGMIANGAVTTPKIADLAITDSKLAPFSVGTSNIEVGAITEGKISDSFMRSRQLADGQNGWDPNDSAVSFFIADATITANSHIFTSNTDLNGAVVICAEQFLNPGVRFVLVCDNPPEEGTVLRYTIIDQPNT